MQLGADPSPIAASECLLTDTEHAAKRARLDEDAGPPPAPSAAAEAAAAEIISPALLIPGIAERLHQQYSTAEPYTHCVLEDAFDPVALAAVRDEIVHNINATYKETDLFKVFQTGDLANLDALDPEAAAKLPTLMRLKQALYSDRFRSFIRSVTGCGELSSRTDCSCNVYAKGGHLLCHDDVIGTRRVSYIVYLTDPDPDHKWTETDGGALELYGLKDSQPGTTGTHAVDVNAVGRLPSNSPMSSATRVVASTNPAAPVFSAPTASSSAVATASDVPSPVSAAASVLPQPHVEPSRCLLPHFNSMAVFTVLPGRSFHAVQEVFAEDKPRMSISGWYHADAAPDGSAQASLKQLQMKAGEDAATVYAPLSGSGTAAAELSEEDLALLIRYINPVYLADSTWTKLQAKFAEDGSIQLQQFLNARWSARLGSGMRAEDTADGLGGGAIPSYSAGLRDGWSFVGPPHKQRFMSYTPSTTATSSAPASTIETVGAGSADPAGGVNGSGVTPLCSSSTPGTTMTPSSSTSSSKLGKINRLGRKSKGAAGGVGGGDSKDSSSGMSEGVGLLLMQLREELFSTAAFGRLLHAFTTLEMVGQQGMVRRFRPGLDYTVAHYGILTTDPRLDVVLALVDDQTPEAAAAWESGDVGGFEAYLLAEEEEAPAAASGGGGSDVYKKASADDSGVLNVSAAFNSLNLVLRDEGLMRFVKYVSCSAPSSRWDLAMEYLPADDDDDDEVERIDSAKELLE